MIHIGFRDLHQVAILGTFGGEKGVKPWFPWQLFLYSPDSCHGDGGVVSHPHGGWNGAGCSSSLSLTHAANVKCKRLKFDAGLSASMLKMLRASGVGWIVDCSGGGGGGGGSGGRWVVGRGNPIKISTPPLTLFCRNDGQIFLETNVAPRARRF